MNAIRTFAIGLSFLTTTAASAAGINLPRDGWVSWPVAAVDSAPNWCCLNWNGTDAKAARCELDGRDQGYSSTGNETTGEMRVYARFNAGKLGRLRALAASCPVKTNTPIANVDGVTVEKSVAWLTGVVNDQSRQEKADRRLASDAMAAIAIHRSVTARDALLGIAKINTAVEARKDALFWLTQVRGEEGAEAVAPFLFDDADARIREHAAFALSQTRSPRAVPVLIRQGNSDTSTRVRAQAWFWLAQTKSTSAETAIQRAVRSDGDEDVRKKAVFALSQLPPSRAVTALIAVAEDKSVALGERKQAVFWLGQSKSEAATQYFDRVLSAASGK